MLHTSNPIIKHKAGLLNLAEELGNVSKACKVMSVSRDTFYRYQELVETGGIDALVNQSRRAPNLKNRVDSETEQAVLKYAIDFPAHGQVRKSNELRKLGVFISASGVRSIMLRGEIETAHPGYLGSKDTFYVGNLKGVGRIYQQTFVDTYNKVAFAKLYTTKTP
ncbi:helix-turn-helix domain-containing protein, partial [Vibrio lentus]